MLQLVSTLVRARDVNRLGSVALEASCGCGPQAAASTCHISGLPPGAPAAPPGGAPSALDGSISALGRRRFGGSRACSLQSSSQARAYAAAAAHMLRLLRLARGARGSVGPPAAAALSAGDQAC
jgi:hypothetical protein